MKNKFIVIEGIDGIGKDTVINHLKEKHPDIYFTREPGGTEIGEDIRNILLHKKKNMKTEILLFGAMRSEHVEHIKEVLKTKNIISGRYLYSSVYQKDHYGRGSVNTYTEMIDRINDYATDGFLPDVVISCYLDIESTLMDRLNKSGREKDLIEQREFEYFKRINIYYKYLQPIRNEYVYHLEMSGSIEENNRMVDRIIDLHLNLG